MALIYRGDTNTELTLPTPVERTITITEVTAAYTVLAGAQKVAIANNGSANGVVQGAAILPGESNSFSVVDRIDTLAAITVDGTGTTLKVIETR